MGSCLFLVRVRIRLENLDVEHWLVNGAYVAFVNSDNIIQPLVPGLCRQDLVLELLLSFYHLLQLEYLVF